jgi:serine/threonine-protein kinase
MLQRIGRYEILGQIGRGGQGTVYRARDTTLDRVVAVENVVRRAVSKRLEDMKEEESELVPYYSLGTM